MEELIRARLQAAVPGVAFDWNESLQGIRGLRGVMYRISGGADYIMDGPSGLAQARVQIDCHADTYSGAKALARQVRVALSGYRDSLRILGVFLDAERDLAPESGYGVLSGRVSLDFIIHYKEA
jgi:hypothetical protein